MKKVATALLLLVLATPAMADYVIRDGNGSLQTVKSQNPGGKIETQTNPSDALGNVLLDPQASVRSSALEGNHVLKNTSGSLYALHVEVPDAGYVMLFDANSAPVDGAVAPYWCVGISGSTDINFRAPALKFSNGIVVVYSTTGCFTKTESAIAAFFAQVQ